jgi:hypothetical protein
MQEQFFGMLPVESLGQMNCSALCDVIEFSLQVYLRGRCRKAIEFCTDIITYGHRRHFNALFYIYVF